MDLLETGGYGEKQPYAGWIEEILRPTTFPANCGRILSTAGR